MTVGRPLPFVLAASDHGPIIVNRLDFHTLPTGATYGVGHQILSTGSYDAGEISSILAILRERRGPSGTGLIALDCGANIGVHTIEMAKEMTEWGRVIAFEPQERLYYALCGNVALANVFNARAIHAAVGASDGWLSIPKPNYCRPASFGSLELVRCPTTEYIGQSIDYSSKSLVEVRQVSIDGLSLPRVDFIKIDVEGMEIDVLRGASETIARCRPTMLIEWIKSDRGELVDFLVERDYGAKEFGANLLAQTVE